jgi:hypothetical protein
MRLPLLPLAEETVGDVGDISVDGICGLRLPKSEGLDGRAIGLLGRDGGGPAKGTEGGPPRLLGRESGSGGNVSELLLCIDISSSDFEPSLGDLGRVR